MLKKIILFILMSLLIFCAFCLTSCNKQILDFQYTFTRVHVLEQNKCYQISKWRDYDDGDQIQVFISGYGYCLFHSNQVVLVEDRCPFCD